MMPFKSNADIKAYGHYQQVKAIFNARD
jgi:hypothetical protein